MSNKLVIAAALALAVSACSSSSSPSSSPPPAAPAAHVAPAAHAAAAAAAAPAKPTPPSANRAAWVKAIAEGKALATAEAHPADALCDIDDVYGSDKLNKSAAQALKQVGTATAALERVTAHADATDADVAPVLAKQRDAIAKAKRACDVAGNYTAKRRGADEG